MLSNESQKCEKTLWVIDPGVSGWESLKAGESADVLILSPTTGGLSEITEYLKSHRGYEVVAIVSEGAPGILELGAKRVDAAALEASAGELAAWYELLGADADLLLYGCRVGEGETGVNFVNQLAALTGVKVAASDDLTGAVRLGGDTELEVMTGADYPRLAALEAGLAGLPAVLGYEDMPNISNPGAQAATEDVTFNFGSILQVGAPGSDRMEAVVSITSGEADLSDGDVTNDELASQGGMAGVNAFLSSLRLIPQPNWNGTVNVSVTVTSDFVNRTAGNTTSFSFNIVVNAVNDAPVASGASTLASVDEDTANPAGATVSSLYTARFSDATDAVAGGSSAHTLAGVAIVGNTVNASQGQWQYYNGSTWTNVGARSATTTLLLPATDSLRFLPAANWFGTPASLTVRLIDSSAGAVTRGAGPNLTSAFGGTTVYSAATVALSTSVLPVNDAPVTVNANLSVVKNQVLTTTLTSTDADTGTSAVNDALVTTYRIVTLPTQGTLRTSLGVVIGAAGTDITVAQATGMTYTPVNNYTGADSFTFRAIDAAGAQSNESTAAITVTNFNEPPVVTVPGPVTIDEDTTLNLVGNATVSDSDAGGEVIRMTVAATNGTVTLSQLTGLTDAASGGNAITNPTFASLTFYGTMVNINSALTGVRYTPHADYFGGATITFTANDLGHTGSPAKEHSLQTTVTVTNVPDAPVTGAVTLAAINEDTPNPAGAVVGSRLTGYTDADGDALAGIAVSAVNSNATTEGRWQYSVNNGVSWNNVGAVSPAAALLIPASAKIRFLPVANYYGTPGSLTVHAVDVSGGRAFTSNPAMRQTANVTLAPTDLDATGSAMSTSVISVNDVFTVVADFPVLVAEGNTVVVTPANLSITDVEAGPADIVYTVLAGGTNLNEGTMQLDSAANGTWATVVTTGTQFTQADINAGRLRYVHSGVEPTDAQTLAYSVTDMLPGAGGTTANRSLTILVSPVNDAPELYTPGDTAPGPVVLNGYVTFNDELVFSTANIAVLDPDNTNEQLVFRIESLPTQGVLRYNNGPVGVGVVFNYANLGLLKYVHGGGVETEDSFQVTLRDGAGGELPARAVNLTIVPVNEAPAIAGALTVLEHDVNIPVTLHISDVETAENDLVIQVLSLPAAGEAVLRFNGVLITQGQVDDGFTFLGSQRSLLTLTHTSPNRLDPGDVSFMVSVTDDSLLPKTTSATVVVIVRAVDDEPTLVVNTLDVDERGATATVSPAHILGEDVDTEDDVLLYRVHTRPTHGTLLLDGVPLGVGGTFTQEDVNEGRLTYRHRGAAAYADSFQVTLRDQGFNIRYNRPGGVYETVVATTLLPHTVNILIEDGGPPPSTGGSGNQSGVPGTVASISYPDVLETDKNIPVTVNQSVLLANDGGTTPLNVISVQNPVHGTVSLVGGEITFTPDHNFSGSASFQYTQRDSENREAVGNVEVIVYYVNYPPVVVVNEPLVLDEGTVATVTAAHLEAEDVDDVPGSLVYVLATLPDNGELYYDPTPGDGLDDATELELEDTFTQAQINAGNIKFAHYGTENFLASFDFLLTDGANDAIEGTFNIDVTPVNDRPVIVTNDFISFEGEAFVLTALQLDVTDADGHGSDKVEVVPNTLTYSIAEAGHLPVNGVLQVYNTIGSVWNNLGVGQDFTPAQVLAGHVRYLHDGDESTVDTFTVTVNDNTGEANATDSGEIMVEIIPVNDDPIVAINETMTIDEGETVAITAAYLLGTDPDNTNTQLQFRITRAPGHGQLLLNGEVINVGSPFTVQQIMDGLVIYRHDDLESTEDDFDFTLSDGGGGNEPADTFTFIVNPINDAPTITLPGYEVVAVQGEPAEVQGIVIGDPDSVDRSDVIDTGFGPLLVTLTTGNGTMSVTASGGAVITGSGSALVTVEGTLAQINGTLDSLLYTPAVVNAETAAGTINIHVNDLGNFGAGGPLTAAETLDIHLLGVNDPPVVTVPGAQATDEDTDLVFSSGNGNTVSFDDPDLGGEQARAYVSVTNGRVTLGGVAGLGSLSGNGTGSMQFVGTKAAINAALEGLTYSPAADYHGAALLTVTVNDQGHSGTFGDELFDTKMVTITVNPVNDAPLVADLAFSVNEDGVRTFSLTSTDVDAGTDPVNDATVTHYFINLFDGGPFAGFVGELRTSDNVLLTASNSVAPGGFSGLNNGQHVITAAQAAGMTYTPPADYNSGLDFVGMDKRTRFDFRAIDILAGNFNDSSKSGVEEVVLTVNAVNDAPVLAGGGDSVNYTEGDGINVAGTAVVLNALGDLTVTDMELTVQNADDFGGSTLTVRRTVAAVATDRFGVAEDGTVTLSGSNVQVGGVTRGVITNNSSTGTLVITFNDTASQTDVETIMRRVSYGSVANDLHGMITVAMVFNDGNAGAQGSGGAMNSNVINFTVDVSNVNDAPRFTGNGSITVAEDTAAPAGSTVNAIMGAFFADYDPVGLDAGQFAGIAITADASNQGTEGRWQYSDNGTDWHDVTPLATPAHYPSVTNALVLRKDALLRFVPVANFNNRYQQGNIAAGALTVLAVDASASRTFTSNVLRQFADTVTGWNDTSDLGADVGSAALVQVSVTQVNDQPVIADLEGDSTFTEAVGLNVAGPAVLLDEVNLGDGKLAATLMDIDLTVREETTFNGARLEVMAVLVDGIDLEGPSPDSYDLFLPQVAAGISLSGAFTEPGPGVKLFNNGSAIRYNGTTVGLLTDNSSVSGRLVITFNSAASKAAVDSLLQNLAYSNNNPTLTFKQKPIRITFYDGNGSAGNSQGTGGELNAQAIVNMQLLPRNDSPVFTEGDTIVTAEDVTSTATSFYALMADKFEDPDELLINDLDGVAIGGFNNAGLGQWQLSLNGVDWVNLGVVNGNVAGGIAAERALLLGASAQVRFVPNANANTAGPVTRPSLSLYAVEAAIPVGAINSGENEAAGPVTFTSDLGAPLVHNTTQHVLESRVSALAVTVDAEIQARNDAPVFAATPWSGVLTESPINGVGTSPAQALLTGVSVTDLDLATTATLSPTVFGAGMITVSLADGVTGDRFFVTGTPGGIASQSGGNNGTNLVINLAATATLAQVNAILEAIRYEHNTDSPPTAVRAYTVTLSDGNNLNSVAATAGGPAALTDVQSGTIEIVWVNDPPLLTATARNPNFIENTVAPTQLYNSASTNVTGDGQAIIQVIFTVSNLGNGGDELLTIDGQEMALEDNIHVLGAKSVNISVAGSTATVVYDIPGGMTEAETNAFINGLAYRNTSDAFVNSTRVFTLTLMQDDGGVANGGNDTNLALGVAPSTVTLLPRNDAPVLAGTLTNPTSEEDAGTGTGTTPVALLTGSSVTDVDFVGASFGGGSITVSLAAYLAGDVLDIATGVPHALNAVQMSGANVQISNGSAWTTLGTTGGSGQANALVISLNANATEDNIGFILDAIRYHSTADNPTQNETMPTRTYSVVVNDGNNNALAGGPTALNSNVLSGGVITIDSVNDNPLVDLNGAPAGTGNAVTWTEVANGPHVAVTVAPAATITDVDNANLTDMTLVISGLVDGNSEQIILGGSTFLMGTDYASVDVGSFLVSFNSITGVFTIVPDDVDVATITSFQALLRGIQYNNSTDDPTAGVRTMEVAVTDAGPADDGVDGVGSIISTSTITVVPVNDQPVLAELTAPVFFENAINAAAAFLDGDITMTDIDSDDYDGGSLTVSGLVAGQDVVSLPTAAADVLGNVQTDGANVEYYDGADWIVVGTHTGGSGADFVVVFNASANREIAERITENLMFANTSDNPTLVRTLTYTVDDGDGNPVQPATLLVTIRLENDAPVLAATTLGTTYTERAAGLAFVTGASVTDPDQPANFFTGGVGSLRVALDGYQPGDLLLIPNLGTGAGQIRTSATNVQYGGVTFGTWSGGVESDLVVTFSSTTATPAAVSALINALRYSNLTSNDPTVNGTDPSRVFTVTFNDGGNTKHASSDSTALTDVLTGTILITPVNNVPVITRAPAAATYTEGDPATLVDNTVTVTDADDTEMSSGFVRISTNLVTGDVLAVTDLGNITSSYDAVTGILSLSGTDTLANYQAVLRSLTFLNTTDEPTVNGTRNTRTLTYSVTDANSDGAGAVTGTATKTINVTPVNDPPVVVAGATLAYTENGAAAAIDTTVVPTDVDDTHLTSATVTISAGRTDGDLLGFTNMLGITGSYNAGTGVLTLTGNTTLANYQTALRSVTYLSTSDHPTATSASRTITWVVTDANSDGVGAQSSAPVTSTINITPVNDAPVHSYPLAITVNEGAAYPLVSANLVSVTDVDGITLTTQISVTEGTVSVNLAGGATISAGANGSATLTLAGTQEQVRAALATLVYQGNANYNGSDLMTLYTEDDANPAPMMSDTDVITITVQPVNSAPIGTPANIVLAEDTFHIFTVANFGFTDPGDVPPDEFIRVRITTVPLLGSLTLNSVPVAAGDFVTVAALNGGLLRYTPPVGEGSPAYASFTFQVEDDGGTANGGVNLDVVPRTMTLDVLTPQIICFCPPEKAYVAHTVTLDAVASSGLPVTYSIVSGPGELDEDDNHILSFTGAGTVVVMASQPGDAEYAPAPDVVRSVEVLTLEIKEGVAESWRVVNGGPEAVLVRRDSTARALAMELSGNTAVAVAATGGTTNAQGNTDILTAKYDALTGAELWSRMYAGPAGGNDEGVSVAVDSEGNVIIAGTVTNAGKNTDIYVAKYASADGALLWEATYAGDGTTDYGHDGIGIYDIVNLVQKGRGNLKIGPQGEVVIGGYITNANNNRDLLVIKFSAEGTREWVAIYDGPEGKADHSNAVAVDSDGNVFVTGGSVGTNIDAITLKLAAANGAILWEQRYNGDGKPDESMQISLDSLGNPVIAGYSQHATFDFMLIRYHANTGELMSQRILDGPMNSSDASWDMVLVDGGQAIITGTSYSANGAFDGYTLRFGCACIDDTIPVKWGTRFSAEANRQDQMVAIGADIYGNPVVTGYGQNADGSFDAYTAKYRAGDGSVIWQTMMDGPGGRNDFPRDIAVDPSGNVFVAGYATSESDSRDFWVSHYRPTLESNVAEQVITFAEQPTQSVGVNLVLRASASSGLPVSYTVVSGPAVLEGDVLSFTGPGEVTVRASQAGDETYDAAEDVVRTFSVIKGQQIIAFTLPAKAKATDIVPLNGFSSNGLPVSYEVVSGAGEINDGHLHFTGDGVVVIRASHLGSDSYEAAANVERSIEVSKTAQTIAFLPPTSLLRTETLALSATASSGLDVTLTVVSGPGVITDGVLSFTAHGNVSVRATQEGTGQYAAATAVQRVITAINIKPTLAAIELPAVMVGETVLHHLSATMDPTRYTVTGLPPGVTLTLATGVLSGKPTVAGSYTLTITATNSAGISDPVIVNWEVAPLPATVVGVFNGLIEASTDLCFDSTQNLSGLGGRFTLTSSALGSFSGSISLETKVHAFSGKWDAALSGDPSATVTVGRGAGIPPLTLTFTVDAETGSLTGSLTDGAASTSVSAWNNPWNEESHPATAYAGIYTAALELPAELQGDAAYPQGHGYGTMTVGLNGAVRWVGKMADGTAVTIVTTLGPQGQIPLFLRLYTTVNTTAGSMQGWTVITPDEVNLLDGTLVWCKQAQAEISTVRHYKQGFPAHPLTVIGGEYVAPESGSIVLDLPDELDNASLTLAEGGLQGAELARGAGGGGLCQPLCLTTTQNVTLPASGVANPMGLTLAVNPATGLISGRFILKDEDPTSIKVPAAILSRSVLYYGVIVQRLNRGLGYFLLPELPDMGPPVTTLATSPQNSGRVVLAQTDPAQTIAFEQPEAQSVGTPLQLTAVASSGLPVEYEVVSGPAVLEGNVLEFTAPGEVSVRASQPGNAVYDAAESVVQTFAVAQGQQIITFTLPATAKATDVLVLNGQSGSGLAVQYEVVSGPGTVTDGQLSFTGSGTVTIRAAHAGNALYLAAEPVLQTVEVTKTAQTIAFLPPTSLLRTETLALSATATSGLPVTFTVVSGPGVINDGVLSFTAHGRVTVKATQEGDAQHTEAKLVQRYITAINIKPVLDPIVLDDAIVSLMVSHTLTGSMNPTRYTATGLPPGVTLNATTGVLSGKPTAARMIDGVLTSYEVTFTATNSAGISDPVVVNWMVEPLPAAVVGTFNGLVEASTEMKYDASQPLRGLGGRITVTTTSAGKITGSLALETKVHSFSGTFNATIGGNPSAAITVKRGTGIPDLTLALNVNKNTGALTGTLTDGIMATPLAVTGWRNRWSTAHPATAYVGTYTAALALPEELSGDATYPQGYGYGTLTVTSTGIAKWVGKMADGTAVTFSTTAGPQGQVSLFLRLYSTLYDRAGSVHGWMQITSGGSRPVDGTITWIKQAQAAASTVRAYKQGFPAHDLTLIGGAYVPPATGIVLGLPNQANNARLIFAEGGLDEAALTQYTDGLLSQVFRITSTHAVQFPTAAQNPGTVKMSLSKTTGAISGSFVVKDQDPTDLVAPYRILTRTTYYYGVLVPRLECGVGYFLMAKLPTLTPTVTTLSNSPQLSGLVLFEANPQ